MGVLELWDFVVDFEKSTMGSAFVLLEFFFVVVHLRRKEFAKPYVESERGVKCGWSC
jgi:hypothetical protein